MVKTAARSGAQASGSPPQARVAVVGCGYWGKNLVRNFAELGALAAICDPDRASADKLAAASKSRVLGWMPLLDDASIDAVAIAAPAALHFQLARAALEAGKHVFVEKPLALDVDEAERLCDIAARVDRRLMVGHLLQYHPAFLKLKDLVRQGALGRLQYIYSNRLNLGKIRREEDAIYCLHGNQSSIADPFLDHANNTLPSLKLFDWLKDKKSLRKIVYAAAGCAVAEKTYEEAVATPEDAPISLYHDSPYSISKLVGEFYGNYYFTRYKLPFVKARFQNVYGPREILGAGRWRGTPHTVWRNVTPTFIWKSLHREALPLDNAGNASRDFIFVQDLVRGLMLCALKGEAGEVYNLASGIETTIRELAETINALTGNPTPVELKPARDWDRSGRRYGATEKSKRTIGFEAQTKLRDGLDQTIAWTRANKGLIERCIAQHDAHMTRLAKAG